MRPEAETRIFLEGGGLNKKKFFLYQNSLNVGSVTNKPLQFNRIAEAWGQSPQPVSDFYNFAAKNSNFNTI